MCLHTCLRHSATKSHFLHTALHIFCGLYSCTMFVTLFHKWHKIPESFMEPTMWVLIFSTILSETLLILRRVQKNIMNAHISSSCKLPDILDILKIEYSWRIFENPSNIKFRENPTSRIRVVPCQDTDRQTWWN